MNISRNLTQARKTNVISQILAWFKAKVKRRLWHIKGVLTIAIFHWNRKKSCCFHNDVLSSRIQNKYSLTCFVLGPWISANLSAVCSIIWLADSQGILQICKHWPINACVTNENKVLKQTNQNAPVIYIRRAAVVSVRMSVTAPWNPIGVSTLSEIYECQIL